VILMFIFFIGPLISLPDQFQSISVDCLSQPWDPSCKHFNLPDGDVIKLNQALCSKMYMPGCTVFNICDDDKYGGMYPVYCKPFSVYKELCNDMPRMNNCSSYNQMCVKNSTIDECSIATLPLLGGVNYSTFIDGICLSMDMDGCNICKQDPNCDKLTIYSRLCLQMPAMEQCASWHALCKVVPQWPLCAVTIAPAMKMYFHTGINEYILFEDLVPQTIGQYVIVLVVTFAVSIGYEFLKLFRNRISSDYLKVKNENISLMTNEKKSLGSRKKLMFVISSSTLYFIEICIGFLLMLLVMTYNLFICLAIVIGRLVGSLICGCYEDPSPYTKEVECH